MSDEHSSGISLKQLDSPMMRQFRAAKDEVPDALLFFRMGDFYELFGIDAIIVSDICGLTLTSRDKSSENPVPMAGSPVAGYKNALKKCIAAGFKVAVCDQVEDPRQIKAGAIVKREITRIATPAVPGDLDDENTQDTKFGCYLACVIENQKKYTLAYVDVSTGEFRITAHLEDVLLLQELATLLPKEILVVSHMQKHISDLLKQLKTIVIPNVNSIENWILRSQAHCLELFCEFFQKKDLATFGLVTLPGGLEAVCALLYYLKSTQKGILKNIRFIQSYDISSHLLIDDATRKHLDFFSTSSGERKGSLFHFLNRCATATGSRLLLRRLNYPFKNRIDVQNSLQKIDELRQSRDIVSELMPLLRKTSDLDRLLSRAAQRSIDPRGMAILRQTIVTLPLLMSLYYSTRLSRSTMSSPAAGDDAIIVALNPLTTLLVSALVEEPAVSPGKETFIFNEGYSVELDEVISLAANFNARLDALEKKEREFSQISTLKIGYTHVFGYYFEITKGKLGQTPKHFIRKQTLTNCERFITPELKELEEKALVASDKRVLLERELLENLRIKILEYSEPLTVASQIIADIDLSVNFAQLSLEYDWCKPVLSEKNIIKLKKSVHPILANLNSLEEPYVPNDIFLGTDAYSDQGYSRTGLQFGSAEELQSFSGAAERSGQARADAMAALGHEEAERSFDEGSTKLKACPIHLITGPNMSGKSTLMRQVAIAQILCQIGSYLPAESAEIGMADRIFTRIGSADNSLKNQSTFMVEMLETAHLLRFSTPQSLLLLDEIGRGTSTYDGLSLAWSILEYLHDKVKARALFSTHYHELHKVCESKKNIKPMHMSVIERTVPVKSIQFSHRYIEGTVGKSYGLHVAELAGIPQEIIMRADQLLLQLEKTDDIKKDLISLKNLHFKKKPEKADFCDLTLF